MQPSEAWGLTYREFSAILKYKNTQLDAENKPETFTKDDARQVMESIKENGDYA